MGPMFKVSVMTKEDIIDLCEKYRFPNAFHLHAPGIKDRVISGPLNWLAIYEEFLHVDL